MRLELLPFIEESIAKHQGILDCMEAVEDRKARERELEKQILIEQGVQQGRAEGEKEKALAIARNLLALGLPHADIARVTGLTEAEIIDLCS